MKDRSEEQRRAALRRARPKQSAGDRWAARIWRQYHLTPDVVAEKWGEQGGRCALCLADLTTKVWVIDHDHKTGRFRGLLCSWCNHRVLSMIERAGYQRVTRAVVYLWTPIP